MRFLTSALEVVGLTCIAVAGLLVAVPLGLALVGVGAIGMSWRLTR
jgi:hypothetical protein